MIAPLSRWVGAAIAAVVAALSGGYVFVYLYRWEWNRAIISGFVFLAVVVVWSAAAVSRRIRRLEEVLLRSLDGDRREHRPTEQRANGSPQSPPQFAWLGADINRLSVFVPVLLGSGVLLSGMAWLVERVAGAMVGRTTGGRRAPRRRVALALVVVLTTAVGVEAVRRATQSDPDDLVQPGSSELVVDVHSRDTRSAERVAEALWVACAGRVPHELTLVEVSAIGEPTAGVDGARVHLRLDGALGVTGRRRVEGCLQDLTVDRVVADVRSVVVSVADPSGSGGR